jgi:hypothetical protein
MIGQELEVGQTQCFPWIWIGHDQVSNREMNKSSLEISLANRDSIFGNDIWNASVRFAAA